MTRLTLLAALLSVLAAPAAATSWKEDFATFSADGKTALTADFNAREMNVYDVASGKLLRTIGPVEGSMAAALSPDGRKALAAQGGPSMVGYDRFRLFDVATGKSSKWGGKQTWVTGIAFSPDGTTVLTSGMNDHILWDAASGKKLAELRLKESGSTSAAAFFPDGKRALVTDDLRRVLMVWDLSTHQVTAEFGSALDASGRLAASVKRLAFSPDGALLLTGESDGHIGLWDLAAKKRVASWTGHSDVEVEDERSVKAVAFSSDGLTAFSAGKLGASGARVRRWYVASGKVSGEWDFPGLSTDGMALSPDLRTLVVTVYIENEGLGLAKFAPLEEADSKLASSGAVVEAPKPKAVPRLAAQVAFSEPSGDNALKAESKAALDVTVTNEGKGPAYGLSLALSHSVPAGLSLPETLNLGDLAPGKSVSAKVPLEASIDLPSGQARVKVETKEANGFDADPVLVVFETRAFQPPKLELAGVSLAGGAVKAGELTTVTVKVRNAGSGPAEAVTASLEIGSPDIFASGETSAQLGALAPGQTKQAEYQLVVNKRFRDKTLPIEAVLAEARGKYGARQALGLALGEAAPAMTVVEVKSRPAASTSAEASAEDVDVPPATKVRRDPEAYAVVIGIEKYRDIPGVDYAAKDAAAMVAYLSRSMGFDEKNIVLLQNERATKNDLATHLGPWLADRVTPKSRVFVYYAGHGAPDPRTGESFLIPYDGNPTYTETTALPLKQLYDGLAKLPTKDVTVVMDACFSGAGGRSVIAKGARPLMLRVQGAAPGPNTVALAAAGPDQISTSDPDGGHGLLTYFLLKGLRGEADADRDGDVTTAELYAYVRPNVEREARKRHVEQTPVILPAPDALGTAGTKVWLSR